MKTVVAAVRKNTAVVRKESIGQTAAVATTHSHPFTLRNRASTHPRRECPSPPRPSGEWLPWAEGFQAVSSN